MFLTNLQSASQWFEVLQTTARSQTAVMNLGAGESSGETPEAHSESDQVLLVLDGEVTANVAEETTRMRKGDVVVIPAGVRHRFQNEGAAVAKTFSVYAPPAYPHGTKG